MRKMLTVSLAVMLLTGGLVWADGEMNPTGLTWDHNIEPDLAGYRIYEGLAPGVYGPVFVEQVPAGTNTKAFPEGMADGTYYWVVTAYDTAGNESGYSNEVWAVFNKVPPAPPTGCSIIP